MASKVKREPVRILFRKRDRVVYLEEPIHVVQGKKTGAIIAIAIWLLIGIYMALHVWVRVGGDRYYIYLAVCVLGAISNIHQTTRKIVVYDGAVMSQNMFRKKTYFLNEVDFMESYFNGAASGYRLVRDGKTLCEFDNRHYKDLYQLEEIFRSGNPNVEAVLA